MNNLIMKLRNQKGVSLIEVLIAVFITAVITTAIMSLYVTQHKNYMVQDDITDIQQNVRVSIDELSRQLRLAGSDLPLELDGIEGYDTNPDTIVVVYQAGDCDTYLSAPMPQPSAELKCGSDLSCFFEGQWVYIFEPAADVGEWMEITQVQEAALHLQHNTTILSRSYGSNSLVLSITRAKFYVDNTTDPDHPRLMVEFMGQPPQIYAENITDLQLRYVLKNGMVQDVPTIVEHIREVEISITGRSNTPERDENGKDNYRDRSFSTSVFLRNMGL